MRGFSLWILLVAIAGLLAIIAVSQSAHAQSQSVRQSGAVTAGHITCWTYEGIVQDCGTSTGPNSATTLGITQNGGQPFCVQDTTNHTGQYSQLCLGIGSGSGNLYVTGYGGATDTFTIWIDGVAYPFPQVIPPPPIAATPLRSIVAGASDTVTGADANGTVAWNSATATAKTETLPLCTVGINGFTVAIKDETGTASTYPITVTSVSTIDKLVSYIMAFSKQSVTFQCSGMQADWIVK